MQNKTAGIIHVTPNFSNVGRIIAYSSFYLSLAGGAMVFISCFLQDIPFSPVAALMMILVTYGVYNLNRKTDEAEDSVNHPERYSFTKRYGTFLSHSAATAYFTAVVLGIIFGAETALTTMIPLFAGIIYSIPLLPQKTGFSRIKEVPVLKSVVVAFAWAIPPAFLPAYLVSAGITTQTLIVAMLFFILVFANTVMFDIRDIKGDTAAGVRTIPVILGAGTTTLLLTVINLGAGIFIISSGQGLFSLQQTAFLCLCLFYAQVYILLFRNIAEEKLFSEIFIDGQFIVLMGVSFIFY
ncbi:MAG: UbiA family prenyltransferase [Methanomicrobiaceae archaeon]|nr:UbiA family prenyltransferase [Methanomicrobiaceae archaeon]